jgi:hypothetical protein
MKAVKKTAEYTIYQRKDNRYAVVKAGGKSVNGPDKVVILQAEGLLKKPEPKKVVVEETPAEAPAAE